MSSGRGMSRQGNYPSQRLALCLLLCCQLGASLDTASRSQSLDTESRGEGLEDFVLLGEPGDLIGRHRHHHSHRHAPRHSAVSALLSRAAAATEAIRHNYELAWVCGVFLMAGVTGLYGASQGKEFEKASTHRQPLDQVVTGDGDSKGPDPMDQRGYINSTLGQFLYYTWVMVPMLGYIQMTLFTVDHYLIMLHVPDQTWIQLAEPFLLVFVIAHIFFFLQVHFLGKARVFFMTPASLSAATRVLLESPTNPSGSVLVDVQTAEDQRYFEFTCVRYVWSAEVSRFLPVGVDSELTASGAASRVKEGGLSASEVHSRGLQGQNVINVEVPGVFGSLAQEFCSSIYCFQFSCIWMYMFYTTWNIAFIWLILVLVSGVVKSLLIIRTNRLKIQELARTETQAHVQRGGVWSTVPSGEVVPGDVLLIDEGVVSCDVLVVEGCAVVNESMLTGEPMPVQRFQVDTTIQGKLDPNTHKKHFLLAGTLVIQSAGPADGGKAVGVAVATGARTAKGSLVRMVLFPSPIQFKFTDQMMTMYALMFLYVCLLFGVNLTKDQGHWVIAIFTGLCILAQSLNPNMPVSLAFGQSIAAHRMDEHWKVKCLSPERIPIAGKVHVMVMDKTGTITKDGMDFAGVCPAVDGGKVFAPTQKTGLDGKAIDVAKLPEEIGWALASCHTVTKLRDGTLVGNMVECAMLQAAGKAAGWALADDSKSVGNGKETIKILKQLEFDHHRMTSGAVVQINTKTFALIKGSYEAVQNEVPEGGLPSDFKEVTENFARDQYYVLGLGLRELAPGWENQDRATLESRLTFLGLLLFRNEMKPDSPEAVVQMKEGGVRGVMCTGDNALTGAAIAESCGLVSPEHSLILGEAEGAGAGITWTKLPGGEAVKHEEIVKSREEDVELVVTKGAFKALVTSGEIKTLLKHIRVYARMKPDDKVSVIQLHQAEGWTVGMVGDGGNDCGALRSAHVGIALSEAEASIVAPFSSGAEYGTGSKSLMAVVHLLRYGRAALATNMATYMYFMVYGLTLPPCKLVVVFMGNMMLAEWHWLFIDIMLSAVLVATMTLSEPAEKLASIRPTCSLFGARTVSSVLMHCGCLFLFYGFAMALLREQPFYISYDAVQLGVPAHEWAKKSDNYECAVTFLCLAMQLATAGFAYTLGAEHRRSVWRNWSLGMVYAFVVGLLFALVLGGPSELNCVFRVNCDQQTSRRMYVPLIQELSTGNTGGCFLGPQMNEWHHLLGDRYSLPDEEKNKCQPADDFNPEKEVLVDSGAFFWGHAQCRGSNNCFSAEFRLLMAYLLAAQAVVSVVGQKLLLMRHPGQKSHFKKL